MTTIITSLQPEKMFGSSIENHKKIAAFLKATASHLEPLNFIEAGDELVAYVQFETTELQIITQVSGKPISE